MIAGLKGSSVNWKSNNCLCILTLSVASIRATEDIYLPVSGCVEEGKRKALGEKQELMGIYGKPADLKLEQGRLHIWQRVCDCPLSAAQGFGGGYLNGEAGVIGSTETW